jgi:hypothetical protein
MPKFYFYGFPNIKSLAPPPAPTLLLNDEFDIVVYNIRNLDFLEMWRPFF